MKDKKGKKQDEQTSSVQAEAVEAVVEEQPSIEKVTEPLEDATGVLEEVEAPDWEAKLSALEEKVEELQQQLKDEQVRALANTQNLQRRHRNEIEEAHKYGNAQFAKEMLAIRDYLEKALADESGNVEAIKRGVELTLKQLNSAFDSASITEINPLGQPFDPNLHSAIKAEESDQASNTILQVSQKGYEMKGRLLRPALVVVSKGK
ncbi:MAG: nucleotide exchange factor GrpE [Neisseriaceae bacterium]